MENNYTLIHSNPLTGAITRIDMDPMTREQAETVKGKLMKPEEWTIAEILE